MGHRNSTTATTIRINARIQSRNRTRLFRVSGFTAFIVTRPRHKIESLLTAQANAEALVQMQPGSPHRRVPTLVRSPSFGRDQRGPTFRADEWRKAGKEGTI